MNFAGEFLVDFFEPFSLENRKRTPPKNPQQNSNQILGVSRPKITLQGSGLEFLLYKFWRILTGISLEDFSGHFFPQD